MDELTFEDFDDYVVDVMPVEFIGKQAYVRKLSFDGSIEMARRFKDRENEEPQPSDVRAMIAGVLCNAQGVLLFPSIEIGMEALSKFDAENLMPLFDKVNELNSVNVEQEKKDLRAIPTQHSA